MTHTDAHIRDCQNAVIKRLSETSHQGHATSVIRGHVTEGLQCHVAEGRHQVSMDMSKPMGGAGMAPSPGFFAKAGLVGCLAIATKMTAAREGLSFRSVQVEVETETDALAIFGLGGGNAAPLDTRITISIDSDETDDCINALVGQVLGIDTWFLALRDAQPVSIGWKRSQVTA